MRSVNPNGVDKIISDIKIMKFSFPIFFILILLSVGAYADQVNYPYSGVEFHPLQCGVHCDQFLKKTDYGPRMLIIFGLLGSACLLTGCVQFYKAKSKKESSKDYQELKKRAVLYFLAGLFLWVLPELLYFLKLGPYPYSP